MAGTASLAAYWADFHIMRHLVTVYAAATTASAGHVGGHSFRPRTARQAAPAAAASSNRVDQPPTPHQPKAAATPNTAVKVAGHPTFTKLARHPPHNQTPSTRLLAAQHPASPHHTTTVR